MSQTFTKTKSQGHHHRFFGKPDLNTVLWMDGHPAHAWANFPDLFVHFRATSQVYSPTSQMEVWDHSTPEGQTLLQETIMEDTQGFTVHQYCQHQNVARHRTEKSIFTAADSVLFSAVQYWGWFTWVWCKFNESIKLLNGAGALCICRYDHNAAGQTTAFWPKPRSQTSGILTWFGKIRDFIFWPVLIIYGGQSELAEGLAGIIRVWVIVKLRVWVCSHGPQILQFILQCLEQGLQRLLGETQRLQIDLPTEVLPLLTDFPPVFPYIHLSRDCFPSPLIQAGTPPPPCRRHNMSDSFMPVAIKGHQELYQPSQGVSAWPQLWTESFFSPETEAAPGLRGRRQAAPAPAWYTPCMALSSPSLWTAGTKPGCFHSRPSAGSFPKNHPPLLLPIMENQSSQQHWSGCFSVLGSEQWSEQLLKRGIF